MAIVTNDVNVKFNSVLDDVVVLRADLSTQTVILWNNLPAADQATLTSIINNLGGDAPLAAPVPGFASINFSDTIVGGNSTGLDPLASATSGTASVNFSTVKTGASASGLAVSATAGKQTVTITPAFADGSDSTGLANDATAYTATITINGVAKPVSVVGSAAQTVTTLLAEINTDLGAAGTATLVGGNIVVTSATTGTSSTVSIVDVDLFDSLTGTAVIGTAVGGTGGSNTSTVYTAIIEVDGVSHNVSFTGANGTTLSSVATEIDNDLGVAASVAVTGGKLVITSASTGPTSTVRVFDTGWLFAHLTDFSGITYTTGAAPTNYTVAFNVDGVTIEGVVQGSNALTFTTLVDELNTILGAAATAAISGSAITVTSSATGALSVVSVVGGNLLKNVTGYVGHQSVTGASDLVDALRALHLTGSFPTLTVGVDRPTVPVAGSVPKDIHHIYWGGSPADWRYLNDDSVV